MRTTIEMTDHQRAKLLEIAARQGQKGFSHLVQEALDLYLAEYDRREKNLVVAEEIMGAWSDADADEARTRIKESRSQWR